jgi:hypothetical protein
MKTVPTYSKPSANDVSVPAEESDIKGDGSYGG